MSDKASPRLFRIVARQATHLLLLGLGLLNLTACAGSGRFGRPGQPLERAGDEIMVSGRLFHTGAPVVLWTDPGGYDAYRAECKFVDRDRPRNPVSDSPIRYSSIRRHVPEEVAKHVRLVGWDLDLLREYVDLFVIHYDVCGTARRCFDILHDHRGLSVHFMLDVDGTIYQTLDVKERAWHAGSGNDRSVGIEIANIGAYPPEDDSGTLAKWYGTGDDGRTVITFPASLGETGIRTPDFVARPARNDPVCGKIHGRELCQFDLTPEQYDSLIKLTATLNRVLPGIRLDYPRDADGNLRTDLLSPEEFATHSGLIGHWHLTTGKVDPGPAFDWDRVIEGARRAPR